MPITYLDVPEGAATGEKKALVKAVYEALHEAYPFPDDVRIFIREWPLDGVSQDGLLGSEPARPVLMMHVPQGIGLDAKRKMTKTIYEAVAAVYHLPKFMIFMHEYPRDLVALDGGLHSDNQQRVQTQKRVYGV
jgi:phenylpyruvate tautomerase PptA (4-oxalocrotonate tautomerase family)